MATGVLPLLSSLFKEVSIAFALVFCVNITFSKLFYVKFT